jgi:hypothetical protein
MPDSNLVVGEVAIFQADGRIIRLIIMRSPRFIFTGFGAKPVIPFAN